MGMNIRLSASANGTRNLEQVGGQFLIFSNALSPASGQSVSTRTLDRPAASTADYYHMDGLCDVQPWDLTQWGAQGNAIASAQGFRYLWPFSSDHNGNASSAEGGWAIDGTDIYAGFSNDPLVFPDASTLQSILPNENTISGETGIFSGFNAWPVYNPDDATYPFHLYTEGGRQGGDLANSLPMVVYRRADFDGQFANGSISHPTTTGFGLTAYQRVYRLGTGDWVSFGGGDPANNGGLLSKWTSTDGLVFTNGSYVKKQISSAGVAVTGEVTDGWVASFSSMSKRFQIGSDWYIACNEDRRGPGWSSGRSYSVNEQVNVNQVTYKSLVNSNLNNSPASSPSQWQNLGVLGQYVTLVPVNFTTGDMTLDGSVPMIRLSEKYNGNYPDATYLQYTNCHVEDGIAIVYALHGFFNDTGLGSNIGKLPEDGGGLNEQFIDVYAYVFDATAAQASAPFNVRASCSGGVVTLTWSDLPAGRSYRIKRGTDGVTFGTTVSSSVTAATITDSPTVGSVYYYQVISLHGGVEQASRVVSTYVS